MGILTSGRENLKIGIYSYKRILEKKKTYNLLNVVFYKYCMQRSVTKSWYAAKELRHEVVTLTMDIIVGFDRSHRELYAGVYTHSFGNWFF